MKVYLIDKNTKQMIRSFDNVIEYTDNYVIYSQQGNLGKIYIKEDEYLSEEYEEPSEIINDYLYNQELT